MFPYQPVNNHADLLAVVDGLLQEAGLSRSDFGGEITFEGMDPIRPTHTKSRLRFCGCRWCKRDCFRNYLELAMRPNPRYPYRS